MKFESKEHLAQELIKGKKFEIQSGIVIHYDPSFENPFRCNTHKMESIWELYDKDIWTEIKCKPRHIHQELMDSYQEGQAWQYLSTAVGVFLNCKFKGAWIEPDWDERVTYRLHPHNELIQAHRNGAKIQAYIVGDWIEEPNPDWYEDTKYRIKPKTKIIYEWMFKSKFKDKWMIEEILLDEEEAKLCFAGLAYRKTGRSWEVE